MRRLLLLPLACGLAFAASGSDNWQTDFKKAAAESKKTGKPILVDFTGSDWCGWCKKLDAEVFSTKDFQKWAKDNVVLLQLDFPRHKKLDAKLAKQNEELRGKYKVTGYPTILFLDHEGNELGRSGYLEGGPEKWIESATSILAKAKPGEADAWLTDFSEATARAKKERKPILVDFTGSDWCGWCKKLDAEVFSTDEFKKWADKKVILLKLDYPKNTPQSDELKKQNADLQAKYQVRGFPTILFLDAKGKVIGRSGYKPGGPEAWVADAEKQLK